MDADDAAGEEQVRPLLPGTPGSQVLVTSRRRLGALLGATRWSVPVLSPEDAVALLAAVIGEQRVGGAPEAAEAVVELCGRLPLAVCVAAARLAVRGGREMIDDILLARAIAELPSRLTSGGE